MVEKSLSEISWSDLTARPYTPSPAAWEDQVLYFLMLDRFSDGREKGYRDNEGRLVTRGSTPPFDPADAGSAVRTEAEAARWSEAGGRWAGGTLRGLTTKMGYLQRLGITALWVSPLFKQTAYQDSYHGYGIQNFLDVDPHFGTRDDLKQMVDTAHRHGIFVILDVILNHAGDVFGYHPDRYPVLDAAGRPTHDPRWDGRDYAVAGFRDSAGRPSLPFGPVDLRVHPEAWPDGAVWPVEFQDPAAYTRKGRIDNWDNDPEFLEGDFFSLKDIRLGSGSVDDYQPSKALLDLCRVYKYWIASADVDGFRIDTVKHMDPGATRFFASAIHEFAQSIGKNNFYLIGEITGGRQRAFATLEQTGLDAALGIDDVPDKLEYLVKGYRNPQDYFSLFRNSLLVQKDSHIWFRNRVVTLFDDHDQVRKGPRKARFCAGDPAWAKLVANVMAVNALTLGIPCIYYGSEQAFDGEGDGDRYIREAMFGGEFGAFRSRGRHFFREDDPVYRTTSRMLALRRERVALRRGRQYLREISGDGVTFGWPYMIGGEIRSVVPWSRILDTQHLLCAVNTDVGSPRSAWVTVDGTLCSLDRPLRCTYSSDAAQEGDVAEVRQFPDRRAAWITVPAAGCVVFE